MVILKTLDPKDVETMTSLGFKYMTERLDSETILYSFAIPEEIYEEKKLSFFSSENFFIENTLRF